MVNLNKIKRHSEIFKLVLEGKTFKEAGDSLGVSPSRASQLFYVLLRMLCHPTLSPDQERIDSDYYDRDIKKVRLNKDYWLSQLEKLNREN